MLASLLLFLGNWIWASEKGSKKIDFSGSWVLTKSKTDQSTPTSGLGGGGIGGAGGRRGGGGTGGGGRYPGGGSPGGGRRGGGRGGDPGEAARLNDSSIVIEHSDSEIKVIHKVSDPAGKEQDFVQVFKLDGSESVNRALPPGGGELKSRTSWNKEKLVTLGSQQPSGSNDAARLNIVIKQELTLSKDGKTLTLKTSRSTPRGQITSTETFSRQAEEKK